MQRILSILFIAATFDHAALGCEIADDDASLDPSCGASVTNVSQRVVELTNATISNGAPSVISVLTKKGLQIHGHGAVLDCKNHADQHGLRIDSRGSSTGVVVHNISVRNCNIKSSSVGAGIHLTGSGGATITHATVQNCSANFGGAVGVTLGKKVVLEDVALWKNQALLSGGATAVTFSGSTASMNQSVVIRRCSILSNVARAGNGRDQGGATGGGLRVAGDSTLLLEACTVSSNRAQSIGAALLGFNSKVSVKTCTFAKNRAGTHSDDADGGASVMESMNDFFFQGCMFRNNSCPDSGAALKLETTAGGTITSSTFEFNQAGFDRIDGSIKEGRGGGVYFKHLTQSVLNNSEFRGNECRDEKRGGGAMFLLGTVDYILDSCVLAKNAAYKGGGIFAYDLFSIDSTRCVFKECNSKSGGGGLYTEDGTFQDSNSTFVANHADKSGGAVLVYKDENGVASFTASNFTGNSAVRSGGAASVECPATMYVHAGCTFESNRAGEFGGAIFWSEAMTSGDSDASKGLVVARHTSLAAAARIRGNVAGLAGGGVFVADVTAGRLQSRNESRGANLYEGFGDTAGNRAGFGPDWASTVMKLCATILLDEQSAAAKESTVTASANVTELFLRAFQQRAGSTLPGNLSAPGQHLCGTPDDSAVSNVLSGQELMLAGYFVDGFGQVLRPGNILSDPSQFELEKDDADPGAVKKVYFRSTKTGSALHTGSNNELGVFFTKLEQASWASKNPPEAPGRLDIFLPVKAKAGGWADQRADIATSGLVVGQFASDNVGVKATVHRCPKNCLESVAGTTLEKCNIYFDLNEPENTSMCQNNFLETALASVAGLAIVLFVGLAYFRLIASRRKASQGKFVTLRSKFLRRAARRTMYYFYAVSAEGFSLATHWMAFKNNSSTYEDDPTLEYMFLTGVSIYSVFSATSILWRFFVIGTEVGNACHGVRLSPEDRGRARALALLRAREKKMDVTHAGKIEMVTKSPTRKDKVAKGGKASVAGQQDEEKNDGKVGGDEGTTGLVAVPRPADVLTNLNMNRGLLKRKERWTRFAVFATVFKTFPFFLLKFALLYKSLYKGTAVESQCGSGLSSPAPAPSSSTGTIDGVFEVYNKNVQKVTFSFVVSIALSAISLSKLPHKLLSWHQIRSTQKKLKKLHEAVARGEYSEKMLVLGSVYALVTPMAHKDLSRFSSSQSMSAPPSPSPSPSSSTSQAYRPSFNDDDSGGDVESRMPPSGHSGLLSKKSSFAAQVWNTAVDEARAAASALDVAIKNPDSEEELEEAELEFTRRRLASRSSTRSRRASSTVGSISSDTDTTDSNWLRSMFRARSEPAAKSSMATVFDDDEDYDDDSVDNSTIPPRADDPRPPAAPPPPSSAGRL